MPPVTLPFEKPVHDLEKKLHELEHFSKKQDIDVAHEIERMKEKIAATRAQIYSNLSAWQKVQVARHPDRPYTMDYIKHMTTDFVEVHGDRIHADDRSIIGGFAKMDGRKVMIIGSQKGRDTKSNLECNFGCAYPEGYRKALRLMRLADKFGVPIITLIDTPGAFPGLESEERHIAEAIAVNLREMFTIRVPIIVTIIGEGGSGGALGIGIGNRILMLEHAYADKSAEALKITAPHLIQNKLADEVVPEPEGGAHTNHEAAAALLKTALLRNLDALKEVPADRLMADRYAKFRAMGVFNE